MLITGESGAGKTENTKKVIAYFAMIGSGNKDQKSVISLKSQNTLQKHLIYRNHHWKIRWFKLIQLLKHLEMEQLPGW